MAAEGDPVLGPGPDEDLDPGSGSGSGSDSVLSDDSLLPDHVPEAASRRSPSTLYRACACNNAGSLWRILERGATREEVMEVDVNGQNGLMVACSRGYTGIVHGLHGCPFVDVNHQDNEGNTALMVASQAGHVDAVTYLLNYYDGVDTEIRDCRGFTALIKAAMTGCSDVVAALIMAGADTHAVDSSKGRHVQDWALKTGRYETLQRLRRLKTRPKAEQFCEGYAPEWPGELAGGGGRASARKSAAERIGRCLKNAFGFGLPRDPEDNGCLDHMVRVTTGVRSCLVSTGCRPLCPTSPPQAGRPRLTVPELVRKYPDVELRETSACQWKGPSPVALVAAAAEHGGGGALSGASGRIATAFAGRGAARRNSVFPSGCIPSISVRGPSEAAPKKEKKRKRADEGFLEPPKWKYKEVQDVKKQERRARKLNKVKVKKEKRKK